jgi:hypothetical protein
MRMHSTTKINIKQNKTNKHKKNKLTKLTKYQIIGAIFFYYYNKYFTTLEDR